MPEMTETMTDEELRGYNEETRREIEEFLNRKSSQFPPPPCPSWCVLPAGHPYDDIEYSGLMHREHASAVETLTRVEQMESNLDGQVTFEPAAVWLSASDALMDALDADQARALASELVAAAYRLDEITAVQ